jgi:multidrug efflux pump subunit AcrA (membrane-fusion protein)
MRLKIESRERFSLLLPISILVLLSLSGCSAGKVGKTSADGALGSEKSLPVKIVTAQSRKVQRTIEAVGSLFAYDETVVSSEVDGRAEKVLVDVGDHVTKGQTLVEILPIEFKLAADQEEALLDQARAKLGITATNEEVTDPTQTASVKKAAADLANAEQKFRRSKELADQGVMSKQAYEVDDANYKAAQATYDLAVQDVRNLQAALKEERAKSDLAKKKLRDATILAPFDGYVKERDVTIGQYVKVQTPVMVIVNVDPLRVRLKVPEKMAAWVPVGQPVAVSVEAYPEGTFSGKIWRLSPSVDPQTRTFDAEALIENHEKLLKPGFFVKAAIPSSKVENVLFIPQQALTYAYGIYKVFVVKEDKLKEIEVKVGDRVGQDVEVIAGVSEGDRLAVSVDGQDLKDGSSIKATP